MFVEVVALTEVVLVPAAESATTAEFVLTLDWLFGVEIVSLVITVLLLVVEFEEDVVLTARSIRLKDGSAFAGSK